MAVGTAEDRVERRRTALPGSPARLLAWVTPRRGELLAVLALLGVTLIFFAPLLRGQTFSNVARFQAVMEPWYSPDQPLGQQYPQTDQADTFYPWIIFAGRALRQGELPLWDPYSFGGHPFFANGETNLLYPPRLLLTWALPPSWAQDLFLFLHVWGSGVTMRLYLRRLKVGQIGALLGAVTWMLNSFTLGWLLLGHIAAITLLLPLALLLARSAGEGASPRHAAWLGVVLGLMILGSNILMTLVAWLVALGYYVVQLLWRGWRRWRQESASRQLRPIASLVLGLPALTGALALGIGAVQLLPTLDLVGQMARVPADYAHYLSFARMDLANLRAIVSPDRVPTDVTLNHRLWFIGWLPLLLAPLALRRREGRWWLLVAALLVLYLLGTPLTWLGTHLVPGLMYFRPLGRMLFVWALAGAILAALGWETLASWLGRWRPGIAWASAALGALCIAITAGQLIGYGRLINPPFQPRTAAALYPTTPLIARLRDEGLNSRIVPLRSIIGPEEWAPPMFNGSVAQGMGIPITGGYESLLPAQTADFWRVIKGEDLDYIATHPVEDAVIVNFYPRRVRYDLLAQLGITTIAAVPDVTPDWLRQHWPELRVQPIYQGPDGWLYRLGDARPPAFVTYRTEVVPDDRAALVRIAATGRPRDAADLVTASNQADVAALPADGTCAAQPRLPQTIERQTTNTITLRVSSPCAGLLVLNQSWAPGWTATVDGREQPVLRADYLARAVPVPAGEHTVRMVYAPRSFTVGLLLTGLTVVVLGAGLVLDGSVRRRRLVA